MGLFTRRKSAPKFQINTRYHATQHGSGYFIPLLSNARTFDNNDLKKDFEEIPELNFIVNLKARMKGMMKYDVVSIRTGESQPESKIYKLLANPNWFQTFQEWNEQGSIFLDLYGNEYIYVNYPVGFGFDNAKALFTLPGHLVTAKAADSRPFYQVLEPQIDYKFQWGQQEFEISQENIIHINTNRVNMTPDNWVTGQSVFNSCKPALNNLRSAYESRGVIIENRGAEGVLKNPVGNQGALPLSEGDKKEIEMRLARYGDMRNQSRVIVTNQDLQWVQMGKNNPVQLGLFQEVEEDTYKLCDAAGIDQDLLSFSKGATFENKRHGERRTFENTIIPENLRRLGALESAFGMREKGLALVGRFHHLSVFAESEKEKAESLDLVTGSLSQMLADGVITIEEYRQIMDTSTFAEIINMR